MRYLRVEYPRYIPTAIQALRTASKAVHEGALEPELVDLIFQRVSQINGCTFCLDLHGGHLRHAGIDPRKLDTLPGWRHSRFFGARERAALAWAEALTVLPSGAADDALYDALKIHFDEAGIATLTMAVAVINAFNRVGVGLLPELP
jgi:AhpD family alkylhydroperoxidase